MMPMSPMAGSPAQGGDGSERPDAAGLLAGEPESWEAVAGPDVGDPVGSDTPAVTPAEWAGQEPAGQLVPGVPMMPMPVVAPPARPGVPPAPTAPAAAPSPQRAVPAGPPRESEPARSEVEPVRPDVDDERDRDEDPFPFALPVAGLRSRGGRRGERRPDPEQSEVEAPGGRVAIVRHTDAEDFSAWDAPSPIFGGGLAQPAATGPAPSTTDDDELPARYQRDANRQSEGTHHDDTPVLCGADDAPPIDEDPDEDAGDEEEEPRTMADLLTLHNSAWSKENKAPSGVLD